MQWIEHQLVELAHAGSIPAMAKCFYPFGYEGIGKNGARHFKIV